MTKIVKITKKAYIVENDDLKKMGVEFRHKCVLMSVNDFFHLIKGMEDKVEVKPLFKRFVFEYAPKNAVIVKGRFALMEYPFDVKDGCEIKAMTLAVDMSNRIIDNRFAQSYRIYWLKGDKFDEPSIIEKDDLVEISEDIFCRYYRGNNNVS